MLKPDIVSTAPLYPYGEAWPDSWVRSDNLPPGAGELVLHFRVSSDGRIVGQGAKSNFGLYYNGSKWILLDLSLGTNVGAFGPNGTVYLSTLDGVRIYNRDGSFWKLIAGNIGVNGIRWVKPDGTVKTGDETYAGLGGEICQFTDCEGVLIGQGADKGAVVHIDGKTRWLVNEPFLFTFIRANRVGDTFYIHLVREAGALAYRFIITLEELRGLPVVASSEGAAPSSPTPPPTQEPPKMPTAPNKIEVVRHVISLHPEINRLKDGERGRITDLVVLELGGRPWGRKDRDRDPSNNNNSDDALCFLLNDGSFEIYDILSGATGDATFDYKGTFRDGQNGFFREVVGSPSTNPNPTVPGPLPVVGGGPQVDVNALIQAAIEPLLASTLALGRRLIEANDAIAVLQNRVDLLTARVAQPIRTTPAGFGPLKHSHEVTI